MKKVFFFIVSLIVIALAYFFTTSIDSNDIEWLFGKKWKERTSKTNKELANLPSGFNGQIYQRYEGSDFVNVWGVNGEYINFGSVLPADFIHMKCGSVSQIGEILIRCSNLNSKNDYSRVCLNEIINEPTKASNIKSIIGNYDYMMSEVEKLPTSYEDKYLTKSNKICWVMKNSRIPAKYTK